MGVVPNLERRDYMQSLAQMNIPSDVKKDIEAIVDALLEKFLPNINRIILFGSYAVGNYQPDSDIDIAVVLNELPDIKQRRLYSQAVSIEKEVDLIFCSNEQLLSNAFVYKRINERGVVLYE